MYKKFIDYVLSLRKISTQFKECNIDGVHFTSKALFILINFPCYYSLEE